MRSILVVVLLLLIAVVSFGQDDEQTRSITSDDFAKGRPAGKKIGATGKAAKTYTFSRKDRTRVQWKSAAKPKRNPIKTGSATKTTEIGLTIWRLRAPLPSEKAAIKLPVLDDTQTRRMWVPERVSAKDAFRQGDRLRLAVESPVSGYLYVINSEIYSNGTFGPPHLIFPAPADQPNSIRPGMLVDFPDQTEEWPYFKLDPKNADHVGELLAIVVSPTKLNFKLDGDGRILNAGDVIDPNTEFEAEIFDRTDGGDKLYTQAEANATCGSKTRQLERVKTVNPCGTSTRQLTREEPKPQSIYRVKSFTGDPAIVFVRLNAVR